MMPERDTPREGEKVAASNGPGAAPPSAKDTTTGSPVALSSREAGAASDLPADLPGAFRKLLAEKQELYDRLLRKQAELDNVRKRSERDKEEIVKHAAADLIRALLPALDSFERALKHRDPDVPADFYKGVELIHREFIDVLRRAGLEPLDTTGHLFDPHLHQAVETLESAIHRDQEIVEELQRGYKLKHRLLRPAIVKVAVPPKDQNGDSDS
jgi:molecular chaperone GrpE